jgi:1,4-alpha-glucan branching enzyme
MRTPACVIVAVALLLAACAARAPETSVTPHGVRFALSAPGAKGVSVAGSFNGWDAGANLLDDGDGDGVWTVTIPLPAGRHEYLFVVDGTRWMLDPSAPRAADGFGGVNSAVTVGR